LVEVTDIRIDGDIHVAHVGVGDLEPEKVGIAAPLLRWLDGGRGVVEASAGFLGRGQLERGRLLCGGGPRPPPRDLSGGGWRGAEPVALPVAEPLERSPASSALRSRRRSPPAAAAAPAGSARAAAGAAACPMPMAPARQSGPRGLPVPRSPRLPAAESIL